RSDASLSRRHARRTDHLARCGSPADHRAGRAGRHRLRADPAGTDAGSGGRFLEGRRDRHPAGRAQDAGRPAGPGRRGRM
ncbi:hypothetical protein LTR94_034814, partial [Friedmanniomyces endolithicus]